MSDCPLQHLQDEIFTVVLVAALTFTLFVVLFVSQFPLILESEAWALASSVLVAVVSTCAILVLAQKNAALPLFALLIALHTMLPLARSVAVTLAVLVTGAYVATAVAQRKSDGDYFQVGTMLRD